MDARPEVDDERVTAEEIVGALLRRVPDAVDRYRLVRDLEDQHLPQVRALCAGQLVAEGRTVVQIGDELGLTRQRVGDLLRDNGLPMPRHLERETEQRPAYRFGVLLALYREAAGDRHCSEWEKRYGMALSGHALAHIWHQLGARWLKTMRSHGHKARLRADIDRAESVLGELPTGHLSVKDRSDVMLGYSAARVARRSDP